MGMKLFGAQIPQGFGRSQLSCCILLLAVIIVCVFLIQKPCTPKKPDKSKASDHDDNCKNSKALYYIVAGGCAIGLIGLLANSCMERKGSDKVRGDGSGNNFGGRASSEEFINHTQQPQPPKPPKPQNPKTPLF